MFEALHLARSFIRIPHLALSLFFFPLILSLALVGGQLIVTGLIVQATSRNPADMSSSFKKQYENDFMRKLLYGDGARRPPMHVCRWIESEKGEQPPNEECSPDRLDVAVRTNDPANFDSKPYEKLFDGQIDKLHLCRTCQPDVVIEVRPDGSTRSDSYSVFGLAMLSLPFSNRKILEHRVARLENVEEIRSQLGDIFLNTPDLRDGIAITSLGKTLPIALNVIVLVITALWLALRAHRKVLDYFSQNGVLLPLVAACGKRQFYTALWILTASRVGCFLVASLPLIYFGLTDLVGENPFAELSVTRLDLIVWMLALISTLSLATIIASISELKHRHSLVSFLYRYIPLVFALLGAVVWGLSFLSLNDSVGLIRSFLATIPIIGMAPIFIAPTLALSKTILVVHAASALTLTWWVLVRNARWFAAHLEEV